MNLPGHQICQFRSLHSREIPSHAWLVQFLFTVLPSVVSEGKIHVCNTIDKIKM